MLPPKLFIAHREKKKTKYRRKLCIYCTERPQGAGETGFASLAVLFSPLLISNYWIRLSHDMKNYADRGERYPPRLLNTLLDLHNSLHYTNQ